VALRSSSRCLRRSPTLRPWTAARRATSYVEGCWSPDLSVLLSEMTAGSIAAAIALPEIPMRDEGAFSLRRGLGSVAMACSSWASPGGGRCGLAVVARATKRATLWVALVFRVSCGHAANASASGRGRTGGAAGR